MPIKFREGWRIGMHTPAGDDDIREFLEEKGIRYWVQGEWRTKECYSFRIPLELKLKMWSHVVKPGLQELSRKHRYHFRYHIQSYHPDKAQVLVNMEQ